MSRHDRYIPELQSAHTHKWEFSYPIFTPASSLAAYFCECGTTCAIGNGINMSVEEANELAEAEWEDKE